MWLNGPYTQGFSGYGLTGHLHRVWITKPDGERFQIEYAMQVNLDGRTFDVQQDWGMRSVEAAMDISKWKKENEQWQYEAHLATIEWNLDAGRLNGTSITPEGHKYLIPHHEKFRKAPDLDTVIGYMMRPVYKGVCPLE